MEAKVTGIDELARDCYRLEMECSLPPSRAGQFVMIRVHSGISPLLRRPMSIAGQNKDRLTVIFKTVGEGTEILARKKTGDLLDVTGPFGNSFDPPMDKKIIMVGGGAGIPPMMYFARQNPGLNLAAVIGGQTKDDIFGVEELRESCDMVLVTTDDGSLGIKGYATTPLIEMDSVKNREAFVIACGPPGMLKAVESLCSSAGIEGQVSTEEKMGCGFGVCLGCMVETEVGRKRVCVEGPVFKTGAIRWE